MWLTRSLGIALHPTSLPGGRLGREAFAFVDWLAAAGARWWQVLPLGPPDSFGSPYSSASAFAGWPGLLAEPDAPVSSEDVAGFRERHAAWIGDWEACAGAGAVEAQVRFEREWDGLRRYAAERGVGLIGDVPIYVGPGSCDERTHDDLFLPRTVVAGAPPDALNPGGQTWGNPLWDWDACARTGYRWWIERLRRTRSLVDVFRIDHFRGFAAFWAVPSGAASAQEGRWVSGPGTAVFDAARAELGELPVIAEDLGLITPDVDELRDALGFPGMAVLLWAFGSDPDSPHRLANHRVHQVVYTSTHDTETLAGAFPGEDPADLVELALTSRAALAVVPAQDVLGLGNEARMNRPGEAAGNWSWRLEPGELTAAHAAWLRAAATETGRV
jgi:4-alpha-glucanotransferase